MPSLPEIDVCREGQKKQNRRTPVSCQSGRRKSKKSVWSLWWKAFWAFSYRSLWNGASIFGIEMSAWLTRTWNQRAAHMICIYRQRVWAHSCRDCAAEGDEGRNGLCSFLTHGVKEMARCYVDSGVRKFTWNDAFSFCYMFQVEIWLICVGVNTENSVYNGWGSCLTNQQCLVLLQQFLNHQRIPTLE